MACSRPKDGEIDSNLDFISNLPLDIKENILMKLPIEDAVKTMVLSTKWRYPCASIPNIVINEDTSSKLTKFVSGLLSTHKVPIRKFHLTSFELCSKKELRSWVRTLSKNGCTELSLQLCHNENGRVALSLSSCVELRYLYLYGCTIEEPRMFGRLVNLREVELQECTLPRESDIESFLSDCPLLEKLTLWLFIHSETLNIRSNNLRFLVIHTDFSDFNLDAPNLLLLLVIHETTPGELSEAKRGSESRLVRALGSVPSIERLCLSTSFLKYLASDPLLSKPTIVFNQLSSLLITMDPWHKDSVDLGLCLMHNSPNVDSLELGFEENVEMLNVDIPSWLESNMYKSQVYRFWRVKNVTVIVGVANFGAVLLVLELLKLLLESTPMLEMLSFEFKYFGITIADSFVKKLEEFPRLSERAKFILASSFDPDATDFSN